MFIQLLEICLFLLNIMADKVLVFFVFYERFPVFMRILASILDFVYHLVHSGNVDSMIFSSLAILDRNLLLQNGLHSRWESAKNISHASKWFFVGDLLLGIRV